MAKFAHCALAAAALTLMVVPFLVHQGRHVSDVELEGKAAGLLGGLEHAMDASVDAKVHHLKMKQVTKARTQELADGGLDPSTASSLSGYHRLMPFDPHPYVTQTQLDRLLSEKRELQSKREAILRTLRIRRQAAAAKAAKDAAEMDRIRLERAVGAAKKRQLESAERASRAASMEMKAAAIAKQQAIHAGKVAAARQAELEHMSAVNEDQQRHMAEVDSQENSAADMQYQQDKNAVDSKLQGYLAQERDLLHKIAAAESVAQHGGQWPAEGMPTSSTAARQPQQLAMRGRRAAPGAGRRGGRRQPGVEGEMIESIATAVQRNKVALAKDVAEEEVCRPP
ncbi:hypothetical protein T484DRAFT_2524638 [Baffinella frigidus]|nr:hypothetical protein T484DRAFT_2524638 [Cryptophyta sp. CCMP2293]